MAPLTVMGHRSTRTLARRLARVAQGLAAARTAAAAVLQTVLTNVVVQAVNIATGIATARLLGPAGRGTLAAVIMWPQFLAYTMTLGIPAASIYYLKRQPENASALVGAGLTLAALLGALAGAVGFLVIPLSLRTYPEEVIHLARATVVLTPLALLSVILIAQGQSTERFVAYNSFRVLSPILVLLTLSALHWRGDLSVRTAAGAYLLGGGPPMLWFGWWIWRYYQPTVATFASSSGVLLGYGVRAWGADLLSTVATQIDRILLVALIDPASMGLYVAAQSAAGLLSIVPTAVVAVALPKAARADREGSAVVIGAAARATLYVMAAASLPLFVFGAPLLHVVYGSEFAGASVVLSFLVLAAILDGITSVLAQAFLASGFPGTVTVLQTCGVLASVPLLYTMVPRFGLTGAGMAAVFAATCRFVLVMGHFPFRLRRLPPGLFMRRGELAALWLRVRAVAAPD